MGSLTFYTLPTRGLTCPRLVPLMYNIVAQIMALDHRDIVTWCHTRPVRDSCYMHDVYPVPNPIVSRTTLQIIASMRLEIVFGS